MEHVKSFIDYATSERRYARETVIAYRSDLIKFISYIEAKGLHYLDISRTHVRFWLMSMVERGDAISSVRRRFAVVRIFYKNLLNKGEVEEDPTSGVSLPRMSKRLPSFVKKEEILNIIVAEHPDDFTTIRGKLIIEILYGTGIRANE